MPCLAATFQGSTHHPFEALNPVVMHCPASTLCHCNHSLKRKHCHCSVITHFANGNIVTCKNRQCRCAPQDFGWYTVFTVVSLDTAVVGMDPLLLLQLKVKGSLALGYVALDAVVQHSLQLINSGLKAATYRVEVESGLPLQVTPTDGKLTPTGSPDSVCTLKLELAAEIAGPMSGKTQVSSISEMLLCNLS